MKGGGVKIEMGIKIVWMKVQMKEWKDKWWCKWKNERINDGVNKRMKG